MTTLAIPTEREVQREVKRVLALHGYIVSDFSQGYRPGGKRHGTTRQTPGVPDLYCQHRTRPVRFWVEVKRPGGRLTEAQVNWRANERIAGGVVYVIHSGADMHDCLLAQRVSPEGAAKDG